MSFVQLKTALAWEGGYVHITCMHLYLSFTHTTSHTLHILHITLPQKPCQCFAGR